VSQGQSPTGGDAGLNGSWLLNPENVQRFDSAVRLALELTSVRQTGLATRKNFGNLAEDRTNGLLLVQFLCETAGSQSATSEPDFETLKGVGSTTASKLAAILPKKDVLANASCDPGSKLPSDPSEPEQFTPKLELAQLLLNLNDGARAATRSLLESASEPDHYETIHLFGVQFRTSRVALAAALLSAFTGFMLAFLFSLLTHVLRNQGFDEFYAGFSRAAATKLWTRMLKAHWVVPGKGDQAHLPKGAEMARELAKRRPELNNLSVQESFLSEGSYLRLRDALYMARWPT
jgi:hypothetical protein